MLTVKPGWNMLAADFKDVTKDRQGSVPKAAYETI